MSANGVTGAVNSRIDLIDGVERLCNDYDKGEGVASQAEHDLK
jgi:hypothetical protein